MEGDRTYFFVSGGNLKVSGWTLKHLIDQVDPEISLVLGGAGCCPEVSDGVTQFSGLLDLGLSLARNLQVLKNDKTLLRSLDSLAIGASLVLSAKQKELLGDDTLDVSDVLLVLNEIASSGKSTSKPFSDGTNEVLAEEKSSNLINPFCLATLLNSSESLDISSLVSQTKVLFVYESEWFSTNGKTSDKKLFETIFGARPASLIKVSIETPLDASISEDLTLSSFTILKEKLDGVSGLTDQTESSSACSRSVDHCRQIVESYLRLLVNSRDELSLANVICGPTGIVDEQAFVVIKKEAKKTRMPLYQTVTSFANKVRLGGSSLANLRDHPFAPYQKQLVDFATVMDKLQTKLEDASNPAVALAGVTGVLRSHLASKLKASVVTEVIETLPITLDRLSKRNDKFSGLNQTKASSGSNLIGHKNILALRLIVDYFSACPATNCPPNLHILLGKIEDSVFSPALLPNLISLFKSPSVLDKEVIGDEFSIMRQQIARRSKSPEKKVKLGRPKFEATLAWAAESSPIVLQQSPVIEKPEESLSPKIPHNETDHENMTYLEKGRLMAEEALKLARADKKRRQLPKRSILSEINSVNKMPRLEATTKVSNFSKRSDITVAAIGVDTTAKENVTKPTEKKVAEKNCENPKAEKAKAEKVKKQKSFVQIKGQSKITAFMRL